MTIDSADDSKISNRTINTNRISNRTYDSKSNQITKLRRSLVNSNTGATVLCHFCYNNNDYLPSYLHTFVFALHYVTHYRKLDLVM